MEISMIFTVIELHRHGVMDILINRPNESNQIQA